MFNIFKKKKNVEPPMYYYPPEEPTYAPPEKQLESFVVAGYNYRQKELKEFLVDENYDYTLSARSRDNEGLYDREYEFLPTYLPASVDPVSIDEDPEALAVHVSGVLVGYVARKDKARVCELLPISEKIEAEFYGGRFKDLDYDFDDKPHIEKGDTPYKVKITFTF